jgi:hypothetical protein
MLHHLFGREVWLSNEPMLQQGEFLFLRKFMHLLLLLDERIHLLTISLCIHPIESLYVALPSTSDDKGIDSVMAMIFSLGPVLDTLIRTLTIPMLYRNDLCLAHRSVSI